MLGRFPLGVSVMGSRMVGWGKGNPVINSALLDDWFEPGAQFLVTPLESLVI
jgi:hypothetical protein